MSLQRSPSLWFERQFSALSLICPHPCPSRGKIPVPPPPAPESPWGGGVHGKTRQKKRQTRRLASADASLGVSFFRGGAGSYPRQPHRALSTAAPARLTPQKVRLQSHVSHKNNSDQRKQKAWNGFVFPIEFWDCRTHLDLEEVWFQPVMK